MSYVTLATVDCSTPLPARSCTAPDITTTSYVPCVNNVSEHVHVDVGGYCVAVTKRAYFDRSSIWAEGELSTTSVADNA